LKQSTQAFSYASQAAAVVPSAQQHIVLIGQVDEVSESFLTSTLRQHGYQLLRYASCLELDPQSLPGARLVLVFISSLAEHSLYAQIAALLRQGGDVAVVPVVQYAEQAKAATLLELGCVDYLLAPFSAAQLSALLRRQESASAADCGFLSSSQASRRLLTLAQRVAMTRAPILISGETGTGKELIARYIHRFSGVAKAPFIAVNCAAIPEQMLESILFGHEKGAFTGALASQPGKFEQANGGTLLLDEIGELPLGLQAKLLRVLQEQKVERLGGHREIALDVRIIAATNRDLAQQVEQGLFRADLMFRLDVLPLHISPLRERRDDILPLARHFVQQYAGSDGHLDLLTADACRALLAHHWPGNVRELENCLQRALVLRNGLYIQAQDLGLALPAALPASLPSAVPSELGSGKAALRASGKWAEYQHVLDTIRRCDGHKSKAAASLGMTPRALRYRLNAMREQGVQIPV
jgi:two-component system response regulator FlrC